MENIRVISHHCKTHTVSNTAFRGFGGPQGMIAIERVMDVIAHERGLDPGLAFDELVRRQRDVGRLFYFMPVGEFTPGVDYRTIGKNVFRVKLPRQTHDGLYWIGLDVIFEDYNYKLRWFLPNG